MDDPKDFIRNSVFALIRGDEETAKQEMTRALEIKTEKIIDQVTINNDWEENSQEKSN
jgi:hypothetical protein